MNKRHHRIYAMLNWL